MNNKFTIRIRKLKYVCTTFMLIAILSLLNVRVTIGSPGTILALTPSTCSGWLYPLPFSRTYLNIEVSDVVDLYSFQAWVNFDPSILNFSYAFEGPFLRGNPDDEWDSSGWDDKNEAISVEDAVYARDMPTNPDWDITYASFNYSEADGYFVLGNFSREPWGTVGAAAPYSTVVKVDLNVKFSATGSTLGDEYRIVYYSGKPLNPGTPQVLVDWTSAAAPVETHVWEEVPPPAHPPLADIEDGIWTWDDLWNLDETTGMPPASTNLQRGLHIAVETNRVGGDPDAAIHLYEAWATVTYTRPTFRALTYDNSVGYVVFGLTTLFDYPGTSGSGVLGTLEFIVVGTGDTAISFYDDQTRLEDTAANLIDRSLSNSHYYPPIDEDVNGDGSIDIMDLSWVGINYGKSGEDIWPPQADVNDSGAVDIWDLVLVAVKYGYSYL